MSFIIVGILMIAAAAACVAVPLWRHGSSRRRRDPVATNLAAHEKELKQLERDLHTGVLGVAEYAKRRRELEVTLQQRLDRSAKAAETAPPQRRRAGNRGTAWTMVIAIPVIAGALYAWLGNWRIGVEGVAQASEPAVEQMVANLAHRLQTTDTNNLKGWVMLGRSYVVMGRYQDALGAFAHARKLAGDGNANVLASYAEALALAHPAKLTGTVASLFNKVLQEAPNNPKALWYGGMAAYQQHRNAVAVRRWNRLLAQDPPAQFRRVLKTRIRAAGGAAAPNAAQPTAAAPSSRAAVGVHVTVASNVRGHIASGATLYVFIRAANDPGPPLAVRRVSAKHFPLTIKLSDQDAMIQGTALSAHHHLEAVARVSKSGKPLKQSGDIMGESKFSWGQGAATVDVTLNHVVK
jgi:cytochrome c-type biogenesis protein CcmH